MPAAVQTQEQMISVDALAKALVLASSSNNSKTGPGGSSALNWAVEKSYTRKAAANVPDATYIHGIGGLFNTPGLDKTVFNAMGLPSQGLLSRIPAVPATYDTPLFAILTGQTASATNEPSTACSIWPEIGNLQRCAQSYPFGKMGRSTQVIDITRVGRWTNRGEFGDFQLIGDPFNQAGTNTPVVPTLPGLTGGSNILNKEIAAQLFKLGVGFQRDFAGDVYQGNPVNNLGGGAGNGRKYYYGLESLVKAGYRDAVAGNACAAADSLVRTMGGRNISIDPTAGAALVFELTYELRNRLNIARHTGLNVEHVFVMREEMFYEVTAVWPCSYYTNRCQTGATAGAPVPAEDMVRMRDEMRGGMFLWVDGKKIDVQLDDSVPETEVAPGQFQSDIYLMAERVDGIPTLYLEYLNYNMANGPIEAAGAFGMNAFFQATDGGRFLLTRQAPTSTCVQFQVETECRLILRTPFLCARLYGTRYTPLIHNHEYQPSSPYFYAGGISNTAGLNTYFYSPTV